MLACVLVCTLLVCVRACVDEGTCMLLNTLNTLCLLRETIHIGIIN